MTGVWVAYWADWSAFAVFAEEVDALRFAVERGGMSVRFCEWGEVKR